jgi:NAD(P)-dependent dehydrogenase (short-subunit alcohol dehydrogenase family)
MPRKPRPDAPMFDLTGRVVLVTGASKGIGASIVGALGRQGATVIAHYGRDRKGTMAATKGIDKSRLKFISADLAKPGQADRLWKRALAWKGRVDVLVNNAAIMPFVGGFDDKQAVWDKTWKQTLQVNVRAPADLMRGAVRHYLKAGGGILITISSWNAQRGSTNPVTIAYAASKAAVMAATKTVARAYAKENVLAYIVTPGVVRTRLSETFAETQGGESAVTATLAMGEWVPPGDIAALVAFLASGACRHLSGATLDVNGASYVR